jgi:primosomal protein N'
MLLRSARRSELQRLLAPWHRSLDASASRKVRWFLDVDPAAVG